MNSSYIKHLKQVLPGKKLNELFPKTRFIKLTNMAESHNRFRFKTGLNIDDKKFNPNKECGPGGIYFTDIDNLPYWTCYGHRYTEMKYCRVVTLLPRSKVYIEDRKLKADRLILSERMEISDLPMWLDEDYCLKSVRVSTHNLKYIKNPSEKVQLEAINKYAHSIEYIKNPSEEAQLAAVNQVGDTIRYIKNPSERVQLAAVGKFGPDIRFIENPSEKVQLAVVEKNRNTIRFIRNPSEKVQLAAMKQDGFVIKYITDLCDKIKSVMRSQ